MLVGAAQNRELHGRKHFKSGGDRIGRRAERHVAATAAILEETSHGERQERTCIGADGSLELHEARRESLLQITSSRSEECSNARRDTFDLVRVHRQLFEIDARKQKLRHLMYHSCDRLQRALWWTAGQAECTVAGART